MMARTLAASLAHVHDPERIFELRVRESVMHIITHYEDRNKGYRRNLAAADQWIGSLQAEMKTLKDRVRKNDEEKDDRIAELETAIILRNNEIFLEKRAASELESESEQRFEEQGLKLQAAEATIATMSALIKILQKPGRRRRVLAAIGDLFTRKSKNRK